MYTFCTSKKQQLVNELLEICRLYKDRNNLINMTFQHSKCFARTLNNCSKNISLEHFMSKKLQKIVLPGKNILLQGPIWLPKDSTKKVSINTMGSNILCEYHNNLLSYLDAEILTFIQLLLPPITRSSINSIDGNKIEKWMLKLLCGFNASGYIKNKQRNWNPPDKWMNILFNSDMLPEKCGLYFLSIDVHNEINNQLGVYPVQYDSNGNITCIAIIIASYSFVFLTEPIAEELQTKLTQSKLIYRPTEIEVSTNQNKRIIETGWKTEDDIKLSFQVYPHNKIRN
jgi:hypothetical protein